MTLDRPNADEIPLINVQGLSEDPCQVEDTLAQAFRQTLTASGFAYLTGHGIDKTLEDRLRDASRRFFDQPAEAKQHLAIDATHRGYMAPNSSTIVTSSIEVATKPNQSESILFLHDEPNGGPLDGDNQWPDEATVPGFRAAVDDYRCAVERLARNLTRILAVSLDQPRDCFEGAFATPTTWFRLLHYPPQKPEADLFGSAPHTDYGFITLLAQDAIGGLEVRPKGREDWIPATPIPGTLILNVGDMLERWSNGLYPSTPHRVRNLSGKERDSNPYFFDPGMAAEVAPLPGLGAPKFEAVNFGRYVMERLDKNYAYRSEA